MNKIQKALLTVSVLGLGSAVAAPAFAQTYASGSSTIVLMNGASQSVGAEISLPPGTYFTGATPNTGDITVTPTLDIPGSANNNDGGLAINEQSFDNLNVNPGIPDSVTNLSGGNSPTFSAAAAAALDLASDLFNNGAAFNLNRVVSIIRAGAGVDGLD